MKLGFYGLRITTKLTKVTCSIVLKERNTTVYEHLCNFCSPYNGVIPFILWTPIYCELLVGQQKMRFGKVVNVTLLWK